MKSSLLLIAGVIGIVAPGLILGLFELEGWSLPTWLAASLPVILIGSLRGTVVVLGWKTLPWARRKWKAWRAETD